MSPVLASSHANLPPTFFQICGLDPLRDDAFLYDRLLREAGCKTLVKVYVQFQKRSISSQDASKSASLMSLQLPWPSSCLPYELPGTQS